MGSGEVLILLHSSPPDGWWNVWQAENRLHVLQRQQLHGLRGDPHFSLLPLPCCCGPQDPQSDEMYSKSIRYGWRMAEVALLQEGSLG